MADPTYNDLEDAVIAALDPIKTTHGVRSVEPYDSQFDPSKIERDGIVIQPLTVFVLVDGFRANQMHNVDRRTHQIVIYVTAKEIRGRSLGRRGSYLQSGIYELLEGIRSLMNRQEIISGLTISRQSHERVMGYITKYALHVGRAEYSCYGIY